MFVVAISVDPLNSPSVWSPEPTFVLVWLSVGADTITSILLDVDEGVMDVLIAVFTKLVDEVDVVDVLVPSTT